MYTITEALALLNSPKFDMINSRLYSGENPDIHRSRYLNGVKEFCKVFPSCDKISFFSAPGRTEIAGNHTDHQRGRVIAASIDTDAIAIASPTDTNVIRIKSDGYPLMEIDTYDLFQRESEKGASSAIVRGIAARLSQLNYSSGGFNAYISSDVIVGSGLSSSAAFEVLVAAIFNDFYNKGEINKIEIAKICQYAENHYFGKPCGLMDQMASSIGGFVSIDFEDVQNPYIEQICLDISHFDYSLCIVNTGGSHADLTDDYASIQNDMAGVANHFGKDVLSQISQSDFWNEIPALRIELGDRPILRAIHFFRENERVSEQTDALRNGDFDRFRQLVLESGQSSFMYNQNVYSPGNPLEQGLSIGLAISQTILGSSGAWRVHGGGFAGTIQAYVPNELLPLYKSKMNSVFGKNSVMEVGIRTIGGICVNDLLGKN